MASSAEGVSLFRLTKGIGCVDVERILTKYLRVLLQVTM